MIMCWFTGGWGGGRTIRIIPGLNRYILIRPETSSYDVSYELNPFDVFGNGIRVYKTSCRLWYYHIIILAILRQPEPRSCAAFL